MCPASRTSRSSAGRTSAWERCPWPLSSDRPTTRKLAAACRAELVPYKVPVAFERMASLPRNEIGKLLRKQLAAELSDAG